MPRRCNENHSSDHEPAKKKCCNAITMSSFNLKHGEFLKDLSCKQWNLGKSVGVGGFGEIYLASDVLTKKVTSDSAYVAKVENHKNGPLFVEVNCYIRIARPAMIEEWKKQKGLTSLGMPHYVASGSHVHRGERYRFLILPKFDRDLEKVLQDKKTLNIKTILTISSQIIDVLEYIHSKGYIHSDIKASNILLRNRKIDKSDANQIKFGVSNPVRACRLKKRVSYRSNLRPSCRVNYFDDIPNFDKIVLGTESHFGEHKKENHKDQVYLLDYGLASKYLNSNGEHKPFCVDERKAHAGTVLFCSRDAHKGVASRRSDLESLGYNMIYWLTGNLPWSGDVENPEIVDKRKQKLMNNIENFFNNCFGDCPKFLLDYFIYLQKLQFQEKPDYGYCKKLFTKSITANGFKNDSLLDFENLQSCRKSKLKVRTNENMEAPRKFIFKVSRPPLQSNIPVKPSLRKKIKNKKIKTKVNWFEDISDPEIILKQARKNTENNDSSIVSNIADLNIHQLNPTYAMIEVYNKCRERIDASPSYKGDSCVENVDGYTYAMMSVLQKIKKRKELKIEEMAVNLSNTRNGKRMKRCISKRKKKFESPAKSPPKTRTTKSASSVVKKEYFETRRLKSFRMRQTYSLRG